MDQIGSYLYPNGVGLTVLLTFKKWENGRVKKSMR